MSSLRPLRSSSVQHEKDDYLLVRVTLPRNMEVPLTVADTVQVSCVVTVRISIFALFSSICASIFAVPAGNAPPEF